MKTFPFIVLFCILSLLFESLNAENNNENTNAYYKDTVYNDRVCLELKLPQNYLALVSRKIYYGYPNFFVFNRDNDKQQILIFDGRPLGSIAWGPMENNIKETKYKHQNFDVTKIANDTMVNYTIYLNKIMFKTYGYSPSDSNLIKRIIFSTRVITKPKGYSKDQQTFRIKDPILE